MELEKMIQDLCRERDQLARAILLLEEIQQNAVELPAFSGPKRRGRKSMGPTERQEVSRRMKRYWARRKG